MVHAVGIDSLGQRPHIRLHSGDFGSGLRVQQIRYSDRSQNADNGNYDQQLDECETLLSKSPS
jgi:hypothetical protein